MKKQITKTYLEYLGVTEVTSDGRVFTKRGERKPKVRNKAGRLSIALHDEEIRKSIPKDKRNNNPGYVDIQLHHVVYAWFHGEVPYGKEIHHRDGNYLNNSIDNLIALTHAEHVKEHRKMRELKQQEALVEEKCRLDIPREHYVKKIEEYMTKGDYANANQYKRRLKYFDNHIEEHEKIIRLKKEIELIKYLKKEFKAKGDTIRWRQFRQLEVQWATIEEKLRSQILDSVMKYCI